jgi:hypothetical protein
VIRTLRTLNFTDVLNFQPALGAFDPDAATGFALSQMAGTWGQYWVRFTASSANGNTQRVVASGPVMQGSVSD